MICSKALKPEFPKARIAQCSNCSNARIAQSPERPKCSNCPMFKLPNVQMPNVQSLQMFKKPCAL